MKVASFGQRQGEARIDGDEREDPTVSRHTESTRGVDRAEQQCRALIDRPLTGVPFAVGEGERTVALSERGDRLGAHRLGKGCLGVVEGHMVEP
jgi:hypothetical protein